MNITTGNVNLASFLLILWLNEGPKIFAVNYTGDSLDLVVSNG